LRDDHGLFSSSSPVPDINVNLPFNCKGSVPRITGLLILLRFKQLASSPSLLLNCTKEYSPSSPYSLLIPWLFRSCSTGIADSAKKSYPPVPLVFSCAPEVISFRFDPVATIIKVPRANRIIIAKLLFFLVF
jgi:hypothetical protein